MLGELLRLSSVLTRGLSESGEYRELVSSIDNKTGAVYLTGVSAESLANIAYTLNLEERKQILLLTRDGQRARKLYDSIMLYGREGVELYPKRETMLYDIDAYSHESSDERCRIISRLHRGESLITVASVESLFDRIISRVDFERLKLKLEYGGSYKLDHIISNLVTLGYERVDIVEARGQFSLRGGILDIFSAGEEDPHRVEFFGDEVDSIRTFNAKTQRSLENIKAIEVYAIKEIVLESEKVEKIISEMEADLESTRAKLKQSKDLAEVLEKISRKFTSQIEKLREGIGLKNMDFLVPYIRENLESLLDYLKRDAIVILDEPGRLVESVDEREIEYKSKMADLEDSGEATSAHEKLHYSKKEVFEKIKEKKVLLASDISKQDETFRAETVININTKSIPNYMGKMSMFVEDLKYHKSRKSKVLIFSGDEAHGKALEQDIRERGLEVMYTDNTESELEAGQIAIIPNEIEAGFEYSDLNWVFIGYGEIFKREKKKKRKLKRKDAAKIESFTDLKVGDYVVHEAHGIGKYTGIKQLNVQGVKKDYMIIKYSGDDILYIPIDQMNLIQKYIGSDSVSPKVNKLGSSDWHKTKSKVKKAIEDMAKELIKLYATRETIGGYSFSEDTPWQKQFEDAFPYQETDDQLKSIEEIKQDMESEKPMDRLLCGDVGYGKTEVAIRAMFKAAMDGKQVVFLVPTTILAQQHYKNIEERFSEYPIKVESLSRFKTQVQQRKIMNDLKSGNIDILIGTHRVLSKQVVFKDLGLLIIDEEQRFGVKQKEALKQIKESVDVLTLTATPIPRTLHMSLTGIRDMSVIEEPPEERLPVQTYVVERNDNIIRDAVMKEVGRGGQVYILYNKVRSIDVFAAKIKKLVPEVNIGVAHGQMGERNLERVMSEFLDGEYDVLICTTIIETGMDIPNVNTIVINDADKMGLSQLYQLRGRVGRSSRMAYAYFMYDKDKSLSEVAEKRLKSIKEFTEFGSGFKIAMRDLEIRGAGNLLGAEQHGQMASIGYDLYVKYLDSAVKRLRGQRKEEELVETVIELDVDGYIPERYIPNEDQKIETYKRISVIENKYDMEELLDELTDRYGNIPKQVSNLIRISYIKSLAGRLKVLSIEQSGDRVKFGFASLEYMKREFIEVLVGEYGMRVEFDTTVTPAIKYKLESKVQAEILEEIENIVIKMSGI